MLWAGPESGLGLHADRVRGGPESHSPQSGKEMACGAREIGPVFTCNKDRKTNEETGKD